MQHPVTQLRIKAIQAAGLMLLQSIIILALSASVLSGQWGRASGTPGGMEWIAIAMFAAGSVVGGVIQAIVLRKAVRALRAGVDYGT